MKEKTYPVTKDGVEFEVRATSPEDAAAKAKATDVSTVARVISRNGTTRVFERPTGERYVVSPGFSSMDPGAVEKAMSGMSAGEISTTGIDESIIAANPFAARAAQYVRGTPFIGSYLDEAIGAIAGPEAGVGVRALSGAMERQRPGETLALNLGGGVTSALGALAAAPSVLPAAATNFLGAISGTGPRIAQMGRLGLAGLLGGATEGAVYGAGEGTNLQERAESAGTGAMFGGLLGAGAGAASPLVEAGAKNIAGLFMRSDIGQIAATFGISTNAARVIKDTFEMGGDINDAIARVQSAGSTGMVADAGEAAQALLDATAASGPAGSAAVRGALDTRMSDVAAQTDTRLTGLLGQPAAGPQTAVDEIMARTGPARSTAYRDAYATRIDYSAPEGRNIEDLVFNRIEPSAMMQAIKDANEKMKFYGTPNRQIMAQIDANGNVTFVEMPNVLQLDYLKRQFDEMSRAAKRTENGITVDTAESRLRADQARAMRDAIVAATTDPATGRSTYGEALKIGGDTVKEREAFSLGMELLSPNTKVEDIKIQLGSSPSNAEIEAAKRGLRTRIDEVVGDVRRIPSDPNLDARQLLATLRTMGSDNARKKMRDLLGADADQLFRQLDEAMVAAETRAATSVNSRTAIRQATQQNVADITAPGAVGTALQGAPVNTTQRLVQAVTGYTDEFTATQRQKVYQDLAKALTQKQGPDAVAALRALDAAMQGQSLTDAQTAAIAKLISNALLIGTAPSVSRETESQFWK
jgi:hypothetical protein